MAPDIGPKKSSEIEGKKHLLIIATPAGKRTLEWDPEDDDEVKRAGMEFLKMRAEGYLAYRSKGDGALQGLMREFDPLAEAITMSPPLMGG